MPERAIRPTGIEEPIFLRNCLNRRFIDKTYCRPGCFVNVYRIFNSKETSNISGNFIEMEVSFHLHWTNGDEQICEKRASNSVRN